MKVRNESYAPRSTEWCHTDESELGCVAVTLTLCNPRVSTDDARMLQAQTGIITTWMPQRKCTFSFSDRLTSDLVFHVHNNGIATELNSSRVVQRPTQSDDAPPPSTGYRDTVLVTPT